VLLIILPMRRVRTMLGANSLPHHFILSTTADCRKELDSHVFLEKRVLISAVCRVISSYGEKGLVSPTRGNPVGADRRSIASVPPFMFSRRFESRTRWISVLGSTLFTKCLSLGGVSSSQPHISNSSTDHLLTSDEQLI
jgi:hypothetical protein